MHRIAKLVSAMHIALHTSLVSVPSKALKSRDSHRGLQKYIASQTCIARFGELSLGMFFVVLKRSCGAKLLGNGGLFELFANPPAPYSISNAPNPKFVKKNLSQQMFFGQHCQFFAKFLTNLGPPDWNAGKQVSGQILNKFGVRGIFECCKGPEDSQRIVRTKQNLEKQVSELFV